MTENLKLLKKCKHVCNIRSYQTKTNCKAGNCLIVPSSLTSANRCCENV